MSVQARPISAISGERSVVSVFVAATFLGAFLLFMIEPMFARMAIPLVGGSPAIWTTAVLLFQLTLLASYAYVHALRNLPIALGFGIHAAVAGAAFFFMPISVAPAGIDVARMPVLAISVMLLRGVGLPFFALAATSPLLQLWLSKTATRAAENPYPLYAASNLGSLCSLLLYPLAVEPFLGLARQSGTWSWAYAGFVVLLATAFAIARAMRTNGVPVTRRAIVRVPITALRRLRWVALAFVPSSVMLGMTAHVSTMIAPMPLLWTLPLALYLATFVIAFSERTRRVRFAMLRATPFAVLAALFVMALHATLPVPVYVALQLAVVFLVSLACHGAIADDKPDPAALTEFYVWLSVGGAIGGVFNTLVAPALFPTVLEYPLAIALGCAIGSIYERNATSTMRDTLVPTVLGAALAATIVGFGGSAASPVTRLALAIAAIGCFSFSRTRLRFGLGLGAIVVAGTLIVPAEGRPLAIERNFFGVKTVSIDPTLPLRLFVHNATMHGLQSLEPSRALEPLSYYARTGPLGDAFAAIRARTHHAPLRVAVAGLGIGSTACYARPGDSWTFLEIDPAVVDIARTSFTFLSRCTPSAPVVLGDARLSLAASSRMNDVMILDAYTSDSPPLHLLSREAVELYLDRLTPHGVLIFNISNRFFDFSPVIAAEARDAGLTCEMSDYTPTRRDERGGAYASTWAVMARDSRDLAGLDPKRWRVPRERPGVPLWTDDYSSLLRLWMPG